MEQTLKTFLQELEEGFAAALAEATSEREIFRITVLRDCQVAAYKAILEKNVGLHVYKQAALCTAMTKAFAIIILANPDMMEDTIEFLGDQIRQEFKKITAILDPLVKGDSVAKNQ